MARRNSVTGTGLEIVMDHWQQTSLRSDPFPSIPFADHMGLDIDAKVGLVCIAAVVLVWLFKGF